MKRIGGHVAPLLFVVAVWSGADLQAQKVVILPSGYLTAPLGGTLQLNGQYTAGSGDSSMMPSSSAVTWTVGRPGYNGPAYGTISATGLYTAPATMTSSGQIQINATSVANPSVSAMTFLYLLNAGPTITAVLPNPLPVGTDTVTIQGTGIQAGAVVVNGGVQWSTVGTPTSTSIQANGYQGAATSAIFYVKNPGSGPSNSITVPVAGKSGGGTGGTSSGGGSNSGGGGSSSGSGGGGSVAAPVVAPASVTLALGSTQQFSASGATSWTAVNGTVTNTGLYTAPAIMPAAANTDTVTASNSGGKSTATVTLVSTVAPTITSLSGSPLPLGIFSTGIAGTGFTALSVASLNGLALNTSYVGPTSLTVTGFEGAGGNFNLTVANGPVVSQPFSVQVGVSNPLVSPAAARRFLEQAAFGPTPADAAHLQTIGFQAWLNEQFALPVISSYTPLLATSQSGMPTFFLANAVTNADQLRQRVAFALSQIFVTSITKLIWNQDMVPYQQMLMNDAFTNYRQILGDVTLSPGMGEYLDMANNAKANPVAGTAANENYAREVMQLMSIGEKMLKADGTPQLDPVTNSTIPTYSQSNVTELARVFTGWTYPPATGGNPVWGAYINSANGPMVPLPGMHDFGSKTLLSGYVAPANLSPQADMQAALDNIANHPNVAPFISRQLIQHLVKSNPSPAYLSRVVAAFTQSNGDMPTVITAILLDQEARANDEGGNDQPADGHLQEPALLLPGFIRAFGGTMTTANWYASNMASLGQDIYNPASVFNYYSPAYMVPTTGLGGPEFQIDNPNAAVLRENLVATFFDQYSNPVQSYGPGTTVDLTPFLALANNPTTLVNAIDLTLTHGVMPAAMKQILVTAVTADQGGNLHRVETAIYLTLTSSYYNVWH